MQPISAPKVTAILVAAAMLAALLYIMRVSSQYAQGSAGKVQERSSQYSQRLEQAMAETEKDLSGRR